MARPDYRLFRAILRKDGNTTWHQLGVAWKGKNDSVSIEFNSLPLPDKEGRVSAVLFPFESDKVGEAMGAYHRTIDENKDVPF